MLKSKLSGSAEEDAELDTSSRRVRLGCACDVVAVGLVEALRRPSSLVVADVMAVEYPDCDMADEDMVALSTEDAAGRASTASTDESELRAPSSSAKATSFPLRRLLLSPSCVSSSGFRLPTIFWQSAAAVRLQSCWRWFVMRFGGGARDSKTPWSTPQSFAFT
jgi:hypothetical protein